MAVCHENAVFLRHQIFFVEITGHRTPPNFRLA
jgi:hypothetical protein